MTAAIEGHTVRFDTENDTVVLDHNVVGYFVVEGAGSVRLIAAFVPSVAYHFWTFEAAAAHVVQHLGV